MMMLTYTNKFLVVINPREDAAPVVVVAVLALRRPGLDEVVEGEARAPAVAAGHGNPA